MDQVRRFSVHKITNFKIESPPDISRSPLSALCLRTSLLAGEVTPAHAPPGRVLRELPSTGKGVQCLRAKTCRFLTGQPDTTRPSLQRLRNILRVVGGRQSRGCGQQYEDFSASDGNYSGSRAATRRGALTRGRRRRSAGRGGAGR